MAPTRRRLLWSGLVAATAGSGCITTPGRSCPGATVRVKLSPVESVDEPLVLDSERLSTAADAVVETAIEGEHVEHCVSWTPDAGETGPSEGLRAIGEQVEAHADVAVASRIEAAERDDRAEHVEVDVRRDGDRYRLELRIEPGDA